MWFLETAPAALHRLVNHYTSLFARTKDEYLKERLSDVRDVVIRLSSYLSDVLQQDQPDLKGPLILVADAGRSGAFGVAHAVAILVEAPVIMILSASTALVAGAVSFRRLRRFTNTLNIAITVVMLAMLLTPAWRWQRSRDDFPPVPALPWLPEEAGVRQPQPNQCLSRSRHSGQEHQPPRAGPRCFMRDLRDAAHRRVGGSPRALNGRQRLLREQIACGTNQRR